MLRHSAVNRKKDIFAFRGLREAHIISQPALDASPFIIVGARTLGIVFGSALKSVYIELTHIGADFFKVLHEFIVCHGVRPLSMSTYTIVVVINVVNVSAPSYFGGTTHLSIRSNLLVESCNDFIDTTLTQAALISVLHEVVAGANHKNAGALIRIFLSMIINIDVMLKGHSCELANEGINIQKIARRLGHSKIEITWNTYSYLGPLPTY